MRYCVVCFLCTTGTVTNSGYVVNISFVGTISNNLSHCSGDIFTLACTTTTPFLGISIQLLGFNCGFLSSKDSSMDCTNILFSYFKQKSPFSVQVVPILYFFRKSYPNTKGLVIFLQIRKV